MPSIRVLIVAALTIASGFLAGGVSHRWGTPDELLAAAKKIDELPDTIGDWELRSAGHFDELVVETLQCAGNTQRVYQNTQTGAVVRMALFAGPPGPTSVHTPDVCFTGANYEIEEQATATQIRPRKGAPAGFWEATFRSKDLAGESLRVFYSWKSGGRWIAAKHPRFELARSPWLCKLMVVSSIDRGASGADDQPDACRDFLEELLPILNWELNS